MGRRSSHPIVALSASAEALTNSVSNDLELSFTDSMGRFAVLVVLMFLAIGTAFFSMAEGWSPADALYFCVITVTTVGFGDLTPTSDVAKLFVAGYILVGLSLFSTCLGLLVGKLHGAVEEPANRLPRRRRRVWQCVACFGITTFWLTVGAAIVRCMEGWSLVDCIYWTVVATCTVGYGDLAIEGDATRAMLSVYMLLAVGGCAVSLGRLGALSMEIERDRDVDAFVARGVSEAMLEAMDADGDGYVDRGEFVKFVLVAMGKVDREDVDTALQMFDALDGSRAGVLALREQRGKLVKSFSRGRSDIAVVPGSASDGDRGTRLTNLRAPLLRGEAAAGSS